MNALALLRSSMLERMSESAAITAADAGQLLGEKLGRFSRVT
jgi:hypothetical protein